MIELNDGENHCIAAGVPDSPPRLVNVHKQEGDVDDDDHQHQHKFVTPEKTAGNEDKEECANTTQAATPETVAMTMTSPLSSANTVSSASASASNSSNSNSVSRGDNKHNVVMLDRDNLYEATNNTEKMMDVTITVESLHGFVAKKKGSGAHHLNMPTKRNKANKGRQSSSNNPTATIVASFSQNISKDKVFLTHVPSLPVKLESGGGKNNNTNTATSSKSTPSSNSGASVSSMSSGGTATATSATNSNNENNHTLNPVVVHWPSLADIDESDYFTSALSTLQFQRTFVREGSRRFVPQTCPINLSISRNGKMALLGKVNLIINGEERGETSATVPIASSIRREGGSSRMILNKTKNVGNLKKNLRNIGKSKQQQPGDTQEDMPMVKIKGDTFQFGLEGDAMLRVLVNVSDPEAAAKAAAAKAARAAAAKEEEEKMMLYSLPSTDEHDNKENDSTCGDGYSLINEGNENEEAEDEDDDSIKQEEGEEQEESNSIEGDNSSVEQDDYYTMQHYMQENNEMRTLRQQLARSEETNKILQMELANAQYTSNSVDRMDEENQLLLNDNEELRQQNESLLADLNRSKGDADILMSALNSAQQDTEMLPFYERRVNELLEDLKRRDVEVDCLREEIEELRGRYKEQLVADSLLWDNTHNNHTSGNARSGSGGGAKKEAEALLWDDDEGISTPKQEEVADTESSGVVGWGVRKLVEKIVRDDTIRNEQQAAAVDAALEVVPEDPVPEEALSLVANEEEEYIGLIRQNTSDSSPQIADNSDGLSKHDNDDADGEIPTAATLFSTGTPDKKDFSDISSETDTTTTDSNEDAKKTETVTASENSTLPKKKGGGGWGRLGASLNRVEEKMRIRQQRFLEQQQRAEREKAAQLRAEQLKNPGLGTVLISRISSHGSHGSQPKAPPSAVSETVEESGGEDVKNVVQDITVEESVEETAVEEAVKEEEAPTAIQTSDVTADGDCKATAIMADDSLNNGDKPKEDEEEVEEPIHRGSTFNQELLLESMEDLESMLMAPPPTGDTSYNDKEADPEHVKESDHDNKPQPACPSKCGKGRSEEEDAKSVTSQSINSDSSIVKEQETPPKENAEKESSEKLGETVDESYSAALNVAIDNDEEALPEEKTEEDTKVTDEESSPSIPARDVEKEGVEEKVKEIEQKILDQSKNETEDITGAPTADSSECDVEVSDNENEKPSSTSSTNSNEDVGDAVKTDSLSSVAKVANEEEATGVNANDSVIEDKPLSPATATKNIINEDNEAVITKVDSPASPSSAPSIRVSFADKEVETSSSSGCEGFDDEFLQLISDGSSDALDTHSSSHSLISRRSQEKNLKLPDSAME